MKLSIKWIIWFGFTGFYVMFLGGIFAHNLFKWTFDKKLYEDAASRVRIYHPTLVSGLQKNPGAITFAESDVMMSILEDPRINQILYLNLNKASDQYGRIRWHKDPNLWGQAWESYEEKYGVQTDAIRQAYQSKTSQHQLIPGGQAYEVAVPLSVGTEIIGLIAMEVSRKDVQKVLKDARSKYLVGALGVLLMLGIPLYFFLYQFVLQPLDMLKESVDAVSIKTLDFHPAGAKGEIGDVEGALAELLEKVRAELVAMRGREAARGQAEISWWKSIFLVMAQSHHAIVVDENNNVLYTNIQIEKAAGDSPLHLLDVVDTQQQDLLRLVGQALERPNEVIEGAAAFQNRPCQVRVVRLGEGETEAGARTLIYFEPKKEEVRFFA
ncbi:MAG: hypothetical protein A3G41_06455 [Elusimicrobia bacterium RIFCSPLOWO2_12_FULL_59_9]|nr:MAG: hypothetical protein A3G41_06455 [Elusimicrobia bacterium RIFCSPLOWO2_12_FULL_59_9]